MANHTPPQLFLIDGYALIYRAFFAMISRALQAVIVSGDKDFYQLIGPGVTLLNPGRGGPAAVDESWVDESNASERLGVGPRQVVDFLALVGDTSDNIPGVKGIGEKGAQK